MASLLQPFATLSTSHKQVPNGPLAVDWTHPLSQGLMACYVPGTNGGQNIAGSGGDLAFGTAASIGVGADGPGLASTSSTASGLSLSGVPANLRGKTAYSGYYRGYVSSATTDYAPYLRLTSNNTGTELFALYCRGFVPSELVLNDSTNGTGEYNISSNSTGFMSHGASALNGGNLYTYNNGNLVTTQAIGTIDAGSSTSILQIGADPVNNNSSFTGTTYIAALWSRQLTHDEQAWLDREPFCFLVPAEYELPALYVSSGGAPATSLPVFSRPTRFLRRSF